MSVLDKYAEELKRNINSSPSEQLKIYKGKRRDAVSRRLKQIALTHTIIDVYYNHHLESEGGLVIEYQTTNTKRILVIGYSEMGQWIALDKRIKNIG